MLCNRTVDSIEDDLDVIDATVQDYST